MCMYVCMHRHTRVCISVKKIKAPKNVQKCGVGVGRNLCLTAKKSSLIVYCIYRLCLLIFYLTEATSDFQIRLERFSGFFPMPQDCAMQGQNF